MSCERTYMGEEMTEGPLGSRRGSVQYSEEGECGDCLVNISKACISTSPKLNVWSALEQAAKHRRKRSKMTSAEKKLHDGPPSGCFGYLAWGCLLFMIGVASLIWTPFAFLMNERLRMVKGLPAYDWWRVPPDEVMLRVYAFNYTNTEEFMNGQADKLKVQELGPYIFMEKLYHENPVFHDNGTMTYTAIRKAIYLPERNTLPLNDSIIAPNLALLAAASFLSDAAYIAKFGFKMLASQKKSQPFVKTNIWDYFWNVSDPLFHSMRSIAPTLVPTVNGGILHQVYRDFTDNVTVFTQPSNGDFNFFKLDQYNGSPRLNKYDNATCDSIQGSTEGIHYHQFVKKTDTVFYLRKTICRAVPLYFKREQVVRGMTAYRFELPNTTFSRPTNPEEECYKDPTYPLLPEGLTDISPCYFGMPIATSFPHMMHATTSATDRLEGMSPDYEKHGSVAVIEPYTGIPLTAWARSQSNLYMHDMNWYPKLKRFSNMPLPMFWLEYKQEGLPNYIFYTMYFAVNIVRPFQMYFSIGILALGAALYLVAFRRIWNRHFSVPVKKYAPVHENSEPTSVSSS
uniref:Scavenger receptor class B member 1 n=1 Tax=Lygus hesperus TaxID=30085 RepID=A0A146KWQ3_LYGHE